VATAANVPSATPSPYLEATVAPVLTATPAGDASPVRNTNFTQVIGQSVQGRDIVAHRIGDGPLKVALVGNIHGAFEANTHRLVEQLLDHFRAHPQDVPDHVSLWLIPTMNPDGLATDHRWNANEVDLNRNADTDLDGCAGNDWAPDTVGHEGAHLGAGGAYPFSEPESRAVRDFLEDAWVAVFYHSAAEAIFVDSCQRHLPTARLAEILSQATGYPVPAEGWTGYPVTGDFADYLAGEGVAAVTLELTDHDDPEFDRNLEGVVSLLSSVDAIVSAEASETEATYAWLGADNTGVWRFPQDTFLHPLTLEVVGDTAYLLDAGRVLAVNLAQSAMPAVLLAPGDEVEGVRVLEPLDMAADGDGLLVLDRAGDIYRFEPGQGSWFLERYDRPPGTIYDHYYVALASDAVVPENQVGAPRFLLETTHEQVWRYPAGKQALPWIELPLSRDIDLSAYADNLYVLTRGLNSPIGSLWRYEARRQMTAFEPGVRLMHPRQVLATGSAVYVLDRAGRRLLALDPDTGALKALYQFPDRKAVSGLWADPLGERLVLAGRDTLYFPGEPDNTATVEGQSLLAGPQAYDVDLLQDLRGLLVPIEGAKITGRDFQMPGAPRHYRLGVHEGIDFYGHTVGVPVDRSTQVLAVADGTVTRALVDHQRLTAAQAEAWAAQTTDLGYTPSEVLDGYRGMQVWIDHGGGLVSRYAHLGSIDPAIAEGAMIEAGQSIATVGNSGTPGSVDSETYDVHLHMELWVGDHYVGQFLRPIEAREWLERILR
jgi:murein DD-endopeptidase MepM/ murein hydrolase activator NlpD